MYMYRRMYICICIYTYIYIYVYIHTRTHTHTYWNIHIAKPLRQRWFCTFKQKQLWRRNCTHVGFDPQQFWFRHPTILVSTLNNWNIRITAVRGEIFFEYYIIFWEGPTDLSIRRHTRCICGFQAYLMIPDSFKGLGLSQYINGDKPEALGSFAEPYGQIEFGLALEVAVKVEGCGHRIRPRAIRYEVCVSDNSCRRLSEAQEYTINMVYRFDSLLISFRKDLVQGPRVDCLRSWQQLCTFF